MKFYGRERELKILNDTYNSDKFEFTVIYGRRRIGKTALIREYIKQKSAIYYMAIESDSRLNLEGLSWQVNQFINKKTHSQYTSFDNLFRDIAELSKEQRLIFVIDEYPYLAQNYPEISSIIQKFCDNDWRNTKLHLILCGSSMSFMERQVLAAKSPLYGRRTSQIKLKAFNYQETASYLVGMSKQNIAVIHTITGGVAEYLTYVNKKDSLDNNIYNLFLKPESRLFEEPKNLLKQELREPKTYNNIIDAIANGASKNVDIANKSQLKSGAMTNYLDSLIDLGIITKEKPFTDKTGRKSIYRISDGCFRFWYKYVVKYMSAIELGLGKKIYQQYIKDDLSNFMGYGFEVISYDIFDELNANGKLPDLFYARSRWWGNNPMKKQNEEIDIVGESDKYIIFGEAKWTNQKVGVKVLHSLIEKSNIIKTDKIRCYILFSKNGFTEAVIRESMSNKNIILVPFL